MIQVGHKSGKEGEGMLNLVYTTRNGSGRIAEIDGEFYPYYWNRIQAQVTYKFDSSFGPHSEYGVKYVSRPYKTLKQAKRSLWS